MLRLLRLVLIPLLALAFSHAARAQIVDLAASTVVDLTHAFDAGWRRRENGREDGDGPHGTRLGKQHQNRLGGTFGGSGNGQFHLHLVAHRGV